MANDSFIIFSRTTKKVMSFCARRDYALTQLDNYGRDHFALGRISSETAKDLFVKALSGKKPKPIFVKDSEILEEIE